MPSPHARNRRSAVRRFPIPPTVRRRPTSRTSRLRKACRNRYRWPTRFEIGVALSPTFALQNAQWAAIHARYTSAVQALYPGVSGNAQIGNEYSNGTTSIDQHVDADRRVRAHRCTAPRSPDWRRPLRPSQATVTNESATISITQLIYDGGRTIANIRSAKEADIAGRATLLRQLQTLALNVANAYYAVLEDNATVTADAQLVREFEVNEASVAAQIRNGAAARSDIAAAQFQTAQARGNLVTAQGAAIGAQATFATTLGLDADAQVVPQQIMGQPPLPTRRYAVVAEAGVDHAPRLYLGGIQRAVGARESALSRSSRDSRFSSAGASDSVSRQFIDCYRPRGPIRERHRASALPGPQSWSNDKTLGLNLTIPIYDQGLTNYNVAVAAVAARSGDRDAQLDASSRSSPTCGRRWRR